jgi:mRNA interferase RelE/StbE
MASYKVEIMEDARLEIRSMPGNFRQRILRELQSLQKNPRPHHSKTLNTTKIDKHLDAGMEAVRLRVENWRVIYVIEQNRELITVLTVRKRPPYNYGDLDRLLEAVK